VIIALVAKLIIGRLAPEPPRHLDPPPAPDWPSQGAIEFRGMSLTYPGTTKPALCDVSFDVKVSSIGYIVQMLLTVMDVSQVRRLVLLVAPVPVNPLYCLHCSVWQNHIQRIVS
jgi:hypothetical protein